MDSRCNHLQTTFFRLVILVKKDHHTDHYDILDVERGIHYHTFPCPLFLLKAHVPHQRLSLATAPGRHGWRSPKYLKHLHGKVADLASGFVREWMGNMLLGRDWHVFQQEIPFLKHDARHPGYGVQIIYYMFTHTHINIYIYIKNTSILHIFSNMFFVLFFTCVLHSWEDGNNNPACFIMFHNLIYNEIKHLRNLARIYCVYIYMQYTYIHIYMHSIYIYIYIYKMCVCKMHTHR